MDQQSKIESAITTQGRIDLRDLADLDKYFISQGIHIKSMSQLLNWSINLLCETLESNNLVTRTESSSEAHFYLVERGLYQASNAKRNFKKVAAAIRFENLRKEGFKPEDEDPISFKMLHGKGHIMPPQVKHKMNFADDLEQAEKLVKSNKERTPEEDRLINDEYIAKLKTSDSEIKID